MPPILTFQCIFITLPTWSHQRLRTAKVHYFVKLYDVRKNRLTCLGSGDRTTTKVLKLCFHNLFPVMGIDPEIWSTDAAQRLTTTHFHAKSRSTPPTYIWEYVEKSSVGQTTYVAQILFQETLRIFKILSLSWRYDYNQSKWPSLPHLVSGNGRLSRLLQYGYLNQGTRLSLYLRRVATQYQLIWRAHVRKNHVSQLI